ncbi:MAG: hypothetical protein LBC20_00545, partial [Planctomycetaceae bacterium]|nr:hypothetical protein [Planctomycetaceae bacterium]
MTLLTDGNEKTTVYNTITKPTVATVGENLSAKGRLPLLFWELTVPVREFTITVREFTIPVR